MGTIDILLKSFKVTSQCTHAGSWHMRKKKTEDMVKKTYYNHNT